MPQTTAPRGQRDNRNRRGGGGGGNNAANRQKTQNQATGDAAPIIATKKEPLVNGSS